MKCPACGHEWKLPGPQAGGRAKVKKGFAVAGQPSTAARKRGWQKRKAALLDVRSRTLPAVVGGLNHEEIR